MFDFPRYRPKRFCISLFHPHTLRVHADEISATATFQIAYSILIRHLATVFHIRHSQPAVGRTECQNANWLAFPGLGRTEMTTTISNFGGGNCALVIQFQLCPLSCPSLTRWSVVGYAKMTSDCVCDNIPLASCPLPTEVLCSAWKQSI